MVNYLFWVELFLGMDVYMGIRQVLASVGKLRGVQVTGVENIVDGAGILAANHAGWRDIPVIATGIERRTNWVGSARLANVETCSEMLLNYFQNGYVKKNDMTYSLKARVLAWPISHILTYLADISGVYIPIERGERKEMKKQVEQVFDNGELLVWFPMGDIVPDEKMIQFQYGLSSFIQNYLWNTGIDVPVYPVGLANTQKPFLSKHIYKMEVGKPLRISEYEGSNERIRQVFTGDLESTVGEIQSRLRA